MTDWTGGYAGERPAGAKIPVKVHRNVSVIRTNEPLLTDELLSRAKLSRLIIGRMTDEVLLVKPGKIGEVVEELQRMGHTPQVVGAQ